MSHPPVPIACQIGPHSQLASRTGNSEHKLVFSSLDQINKITIPRRWTSRTMKNTMLQPRNCINRLRQNPVRAAIWEAVQDQSIHISNIKQGAVTSGTKVLLLQDPTSTCHTIQNKRLVGYGHLVAQKSVEYFPKKSVVAARKWPKTRSWTPSNRHIWKGRELDAQPNPVFHRTPRVQEQTH